LKIGALCIWVSFTRRNYPPALKFFGLDPDGVVYIDVPYLRDVLWITEEAFKCEGVKQVIQWPAETP